MPQPRKTAADQPEKLNVTPLIARPPKAKTTGRPPKLEMPELPQFEMNELEQRWYDFFLYVYHRLYPDLDEADDLLLFLAGLEFIKYLRVVQEEMKTGTVISMARQHPGVQMRALLDQLSVTRKARNAGRKEDPMAAAREELLKWSS